MTITELRRGADGSFSDDGSKVFVFSGPEHSSMQGILELHLKANHVRKEIPGGNRVIHQMLSATWQPFTIEGEWDDKWGNRGFANSAERTGSFAFYMYQQLSELVGRMPVVRFELDAISITGVLSDLTVRYQTQNKIGWALTISPESNENVDVFPPRPLSSQSIQKWTEDEKILIDSLNESFDNARRIPMKTERLSDLTQKLLEINDGMDRLQRLSADDFASDTSKKLLLMATTFRRLRGAGVAMATAVSRVTAPLDVAYDDVLISMEHTEWIAGAHATSMQIVGTSYRAEKDMKKRAGQKPRAIYRPMRGEALEKISARFYGTADSWRVIYDANNLDSLLLDGTEELIIPEKRS